MPATSAVQIGPRTSADLPMLAEVLAAQQPSSRYPFRWPLPFPVADFLVRSHEETAWVARIDSRPVGHVSIGRVEGDLADPFSQATGRPAGELAIISVLFVALDVLGSGVGGRLLDTAVDWAGQRGRLPVLDVVDSHGTALAVYRHRGWSVVGEMRPSWLPADAGPMLLMRLGGEEQLGGVEP